MCCQARDYLHLHRKKKSSKSKAAKDPEALLERDVDAVASSSSRVLDAGPEADKTASEKRFEAEQLKRVRFVRRPVYWTGILDERTAGC
jgi:hypothetical protein